MMAASNELRDMTVAVYCIIELQVKATNENAALMASYPQVKELEQRLNEMGYPFEMQQPRVRRPQASEKAKERERKRKKAQGE